jgi:hypothetical protein
MNRFLGKHPAKLDHRTLQLRDYVADPLPPPPDNRRWDAAVPEWLNAGNDQYGNCVIATAAHLILCWKANESKDPRPITDSAVIDLSRRMHALNGYAILDRLNYWRKHTMWANKLHSYAAIDADDKNLLQFAINAFGALDIGLALPNAWRHTNVWDTGRGHNFAPGSWGLHSVPIIGYDNHALYLVTWGEICALTYDALGYYSDERYALINKAWFEADATTPSGFNLKALEADLASIAD